MCIKTHISLVDQLTVEALVTHAGLISGYQNNSLTVWIERECHTPDTVSGVDPSYVYDVNPSGCPRGAALTAGRTVQAVRYGPAVRLARLYANRGTR